MTDADFDAYFRLATTTPDDANTAIADALPQFATLPQSSQDDIRIAASLISTCSTLCQSLCKITTKDLVKTYGLSARTLLHMLCPSSKNGNANAFTIPTRKASVNAAGLLERTTEASSTTCDIDWGPIPGPVRNSLSISSQYFCSWLGGDAAMAVLNFIYAFASSPAAWTVAWNACPIEHDHLDFPALAEKAEALRARSSCDLSTRVVATLARAVIDALKPVLKALYTSSTMLPQPTSTYFEERIVHVSPHDVTAAAPHQYANLVKTTQVHSPLPTTSSVPSYTPNFKDESSSQWFKTADYYFSKCSFPQSDLVRGDASAERKFHHYVGEVISKRLMCMKLSEAQIMQHLSQSFTRADMHYQLAKEKAESAECTVREWLDAIRDVYFTNGQYRLHIESAWIAYRSGQAADFNDLVHHIRIYYQLLYLDYADLPGHLSLVEFARHLFDKLLHLLSAACTSTLATVIKMFLPLPELIAAAGEHLDNADRLPRAEADKRATAFISWAVERLQTAKHTANNTKRYSAASTNHHQGVDYATTKATERETSTPPDRETRRRLTTLAYTDHAPADAHTYSHDSDRNLKPRMQPTPPGPASPPGHLLSLECYKAFHAARRGTLRQKQSFLDSYKKELPRYIIDNYYTNELERHSEDDTVCALHAEANRHLPYKLPTTPTTLTMYHLEVLLIHKKLLCGVCSKDLPDEQRCHDYAGCGTLKRLIPDRLAKFGKNQSNKGKGLIAADPALPLPAPGSLPRGSSLRPSSATSTRKRYDAPTTNGTNAPPVKRTRDHSTSTPLHIR